MTGPVKIPADARAYLKQRSLIAIDSNFSAETLANLLITTSFDPKIPKQTTNVIRAVVLLLVSELQSIFPKDITAAIVDKLQAPTTLLLNKLNHEKDFQAASDVDRTKLTHQLHSIITSSNDKLQLLDTALISLDEIMANLAMLNPTTSLDAPHNLADHLELLAILAKTLTNSTDEIQKSLASSCTLCWKYQVAWTFLSHGSITWTIS